MPDVDIVITTYRNHSKVEKCLSAIIERTKFVDYHVYIMANDPDDRMKKIIHDAIFVDDIQYTHRVTPFFNDNNDGSFSSNNNELIREGSSKYVLLLNDDIEPINRDWLLNMKRILDADDKVGAVGSLLFYPNKRIQHCGVFFSRKTNNLPFHMFYRGDADKVSSFISVPRCYQAVTGACMLFRREDFEKIGGLHEEYYYCYEDVDFCLHLKDKLNKLCVYCPSSQLIHHEGISGTFTNHPRLKHNISIFRKRCSGKYFDDYDTYLNNPRYRIYGQA